MHMLHALRSRVHSAVHLAVQDANLPAIWSAYRRASGASCAVRPSQIAADLCHAGSLQRRVEDEAGEASHLHVSTPCLRADCPTWAAAKVKAAADAACTVTALRLALRLQARTRFRRSTR